MIVTFAQWLDKVDGFLEDCYGLGHRDLPDALWNDWFEDGLTPEQAFQEYCENEQE